jgi:hypothetical protein
LTGITFSFVFMAPEILQSPCQLRIAVISPGNAGPAPGRPAGWDAVLPGKTDSPLSILDSGPNQFNRLSY